MAARPLQLKFEILLIPILPARGENEKE